MHYFVHYDNGVLKNHLLTPESYKAKMLRRDATRVELKMHLRAHTGAQRVTK